VAEIEDSLDCKERSTKFSLNCSIRASIHICSYEKLTVIITAKKTQEKIEKNREISLRQRYLRERRGKNSLELCSQAFEILLPGKSCCFAIRRFSRAGSKVTGSIALWTALV